MIGLELYAEIRAVGEPLGVIELDRSSASKNLDLLRRRFVASSSARWWWSALVDDSVTLEYGENDGLSLMETLVGSDSRVLFVPTDDEVSPWPVFAADAQCVVTLLKEMPFLEYFVADVETRWIVFDTHSNSLVVAGTLKNEAKSLEKRM